jgi:hypothetical protein
MAVRVLEGGTQQHFEQDAPGGPEYSGLDNSTCPTEEPKVQSDT